MRVAIVHERFTIRGGAERVVEELHHIFPGAPIHAALVDRSVLSPELAKADVRTTFLQRLYHGRDRYSHLLPLLPVAFAQLDLRDVDLVVTSHYAFANRIRPPADIPIVSYTHTPARWIWDAGMRRGEKGGAAGRMVLGSFAATQRRSDRRAARRTRAVIVNSRNVATRIDRWWNLPSTVVPPPVDVDWFTPAPLDREDFFLVTGRLVPYKKALVAVAAAKQAGVRLVVAGEGRQLAQVEAETDSRIEAVGRVGDEELRDLYRRCRALLFPGEEDFGIVPVEAQACGTPIIARAAGGALESVIDGTTGVLYPPALEGRAEVDALAGALRTFEQSRFDPAAIRANAESFSPVRFRQEFVAATEKALGRSIQT